MPRTKDEIIQYNMKYNSEHTKQIKMSLNTRTDADIIEHLGKQPNKQKYIQDLIRNDMEGGAK